MRPFLDIRGVTKAYGDGAARHVVLDNVNLTVARGDFVVIVGCSGSGKSTLLSLLAGLTRPDSGTIHFDGREVREPDAKCGVVFQQYSLLPWLTVYDNVRLAVDQVFARESAQERRKRIEHMIELVNLSPALGKRPHELSGGMKQRVAIARALAMNPEILLLDEPFGALDALTRGTLQGEIERIWEADRKTVVMISNDVDEALLLADRIVPLTADGRLGEPIPVPAARPREHADLDRDPALRSLRIEVARRLRGADGRDEDAGVGGSGQAVTPLGVVPARKPAPVFLQLAGIEKTYDTRRGAQNVIRDINFEIREGEFVSIIGHSGCGKSTIMSIVAGLTAPTGGTITLGGEPVRGPGPERALVFQSHSLLPWLTAEENVRLGVDQVFAASSAAERRAIVDEYLDLVGLSASKHKRPASLSAGMRQRVGVARAFALAPKLLLLDEPFGSLDSVTRAELQDVLVALRQRTRTSALLVTHDVDEALYLSDRILLMTDGPSAVIGKVLEVRFPLPRDRRHLLDDPAYPVLRKEMIAFLEHTTSSRTRAVEKHTAEKQVRASMG